MKNKQKSLRQLARELGISQSYLSQIKNGTRPASHKVISKLRALTRQNSFKRISKNDEHNLHSKFVSGTLPCYNPDALGISLAVGQRTLDP